MAIKKTYGIDGSYYQGNIAWKEDNIDYVEVRDSSFKLLGILDYAKSVIWRSKYYGVGDFQIDIEVNQNTVDWLQLGYYITRPNNAEVGVIETISATNSINDGFVITASGRFAKSILNRRHIYKLSGHTNTATILRGKVEAAVRQVVSDNAINCSFDTARNIPVLALGAESGIEDIIVDENGKAAQKQVSYQNLFEYTESVLEEYGLAATVTLDIDAWKLKYKIYRGKDRSATNTEDNTPVVFSQEFDNLTDSTYSIDEKSEKNTALIGGVGEDLARFYSLLADGSTGLSRRETWIDASSINKTYKDESNAEKEYTDSEYDEMLKMQGKQGIAKLIVVEDFKGTIDITNGNYIYGRDFTLGDIVTVQDNALGKFINVRITEILEYQDENGYTIEATYSAGE